MEKYQVSRKQITDAALSCRGYKFQHQARGENKSCDCVGLLVVVGRMIEYPEIFDVTDYRRVPSADTIRQTLRKNCDEIDVSEALPGDIFLMRMGGIKPRHASIFLGNEWNGEPAIIHAVAPFVKVQPMSDFPKSWFVAAFRIRGAE